MPLLAERISPDQFFGMRKTSSLEKQLGNWLDVSLASPVPKAVRAFVFCVSRRELACVLELNGTAEFSRVSSGWTWSEIWSPDAPKLTIPPGDACGRFSEHCRKVRNAIRHYLEAGVHAHRLTAAEGIAIETLGEGFALIWTRDQPRQVHIFE